MAAPTQHQEMEEEQHFGDDAAHAHEEEEGGPASQGQDAELVSIVKHHLEGPLAELLQRRLLPMASEIFADVEALAQDMRRTEHLAQDEKKQIGDELARVQQLATGFYQKMQQVMQGMLGFAPALPGMPGPGDAGGAALMGLPNGGGGHHDGLEH